MNMKTLRHELYLLLLSTFFAAGIANTFCGEKSAFIMQHGFETETPNWKFQNFGESEATGILDGTVYYGGTKSAKIEKNNTSGYAAWTSTVNVAALTRYKISLWYKTADYHKASWIVVYLRSKEKIMDTRIFKLEGSTDWRFFEEEISTGTYTVSITIELRIQGDRQTTWYDNVAIAYAGFARIPAYSPQKELIKISEEAAERLIKDAVLIAEEEQFAIISPKGLPRIIDDPSAGNGKCGRISGDDPPYFQLKWDWKQSVPPGFKYTLYGRIKIKKTGNEGTAFQTGIYDTGQQRYVTENMQPAAESVDNMLWTTYKIGTFSLEEKQTVYVGPTRNGKNIEEIYVDHFFIVPGDEACRNFWEDYRKYEPTVQFYLRPDKQGSIGLKIKDTNLNIGYLLTEDTRMMEESFAGFAVDYSSTEGYIKRVLFSLGIAGRQITPGAKIDTGYGKDTIDEIIEISQQKELGRYEKIAVDLAKYAPVGWNGELWFTILSKNILSTFTGQIIEPSAENLNIREYRIIPEKETEVNMDEKSRKIFQKKTDSLRIDRLKSFF